MKITDSPMKQHSSIASIMSIVFTFLFTTLCWIFFRAESFTHAMIIINRIVACESRLEQPYLWSFVSLAILCICSMISFIKSKNICVKTKYNISIINAFYPVFDLSKFWSLVIFFVFCGLTLCLAYTGGSPFIYGNY